MTRGDGIPAGREQSYRDGMFDTAAIRLRWEAVSARLDELGKRLFAAAEVAAAGWVGLKAVAADRRDDDQEGAEGRVRSR